MLVESKGKECFNKSFNSIYKVLSCTLSVSQDQKTPSMKILTRRKIKNEKNGNFHTVKAKYLAMFYG